MIRNHWRLLHLGAILCGVAPNAWGDDISLINSFIEVARAECAQFIDVGEYKGEPTAGFSSLDENFFILTDDAIKTYTIGDVHRGQRIHVISKHEMLCADNRMNTECGSSGCAYTIIAGEHRYQVHGGEPQVVSAYGENILLTTVFQGKCGARSSETLCIEALTWDRKAEKLVSLRSGPNP